LSLHSLFFLSKIREDKTLIKQWMKCKVRIAVQDALVKEPVIQQFSAGPSVKPVCLRDVYNVYRSHDSGGGPYGESSAVGLSNLFGFLEAISF
jgi:hypothetical protein